jgi:uncharacterized membrane protein
MLLSSTVIYLRERVVVGQSQQAERACYWALLVIAVCRFIAWLIFQSWRGRQYVSLKYLWTSAGLHSVTF